ncbi:hypothetical protein H9L10_06325 [Phycicoccus endophyticus]|uniref:NUDIX hydrolase n=1 Tax=Phycicoccus endophyticus TaxID=1690220 RepID=A0A7G9R5S7_9MICO|nr:hypothetical protein [Phycicoccus endophyticus]QNN50952.1 hypothetical protein H9L10_06325 [Phycicoccus endophyticus]
MDVLQVATFLVIALIAAAWYLSYAAARLDRLHTKVEGAMSALDAQLVRRAEATLELATSGALDPATALLLTDAATESIERTTEHPLAEDLLDGQHFGGREQVEATLTEVLSLTLTDELVTGLRAEGDELVEEALERIGASALRVRMARRFHNDAVREVRRVRAKRAVRWFRLAGHAGLPERVEFDDEVPAALGR